VGPHGHQTPQNQKRNLDCLKPNVLCFVFVLFFSFECLFCFHDAVCVCVCVPGIVLPACVMSNTLFLQNLNVC